MNMSEENIEATAGQAQAQNTPDPAPAPAPAPAPIEVKEAKVVDPTRVPTSGQSGPPLVLSWEKMNAKERAVVNALTGTGTGTRTIFTISDLAAECFFGEANSEAQAYSWARNSLRRLVRGEWVEKFVRGSFRITQKGRARMTTVDERE